MKPGDGRAIVAVDFARAIRASGILSAEDRAVLSREAPVTIAGVDRASTTSLDWPRHKIAISSDRRSAGTAVLARVIHELRPDSLDQGLARGLPWALACLPPSGTYEPRCPAQRVLHQIVLEHFETFRGQAASLREGEGLPRFVEQEFRDFLGCGCLASGFGRFHCDGCGLDRLVPFSCKGRGFCPSCGGRRMAERAAHLVDHVFPDVSIRQWVLSLPHRLRYLLAWAHDLCRAVVAVYLRAVLGFLRRRARRDGVTDGRARGFGNMASRPKTSSRSRPGPVMRTWAASICTPGLSRGPVNAIVSSASVGMRCVHRLRRIGCASTAMDTCGSRCAIHGRMGRRICSSTLSNF